MKKTLTKVENLKLQQKSETITSITHASQRSYKLKQTQMTKYLNLNYFKLHPCSITKKHNHKHCMYYHNAKDRKRFGDFYSDTLCSYIKNGEKCPQGDACTFAHSLVEQLYQSKTYKKKFCSHYPNNVEKCEYGDFCSFAHNQEEIRIPLIHNYIFDQDFYMFYYKTEFCPLNLTQHDKAKCVYAHNLQDYRRNPSAHYYEPIDCYNWKMKDFIYDYDQGCQNGINCNMCHGWKELHYHPKYYRTKKCLEVGCKKGQCPNYHSEKERRVLPEDIENQCFTLVPRNRIVNGVFKQENMQQTFIPKKQFTTQSVCVKNRPMSQNDFTSKSSLSSINMPEGEYIQKQAPLFFMDQSPVDSEGEEDSSSTENQIQNQVEKLMLDE